MLRNMPQLTGNSEKDITVLYDYVVALRRELYDLLNNLDDDNMAKITAKSIETSTLVVGDNIAMGPNAVISWGQVTSPPFIPQTPEDLQALALDSPMLTWIGPTGIYTGSLTANQITAGTIDAAYISTNISQVNKNLSLGAGFQSQSSISFDGNGGIDAYQGVLEFNALGGMDFLGTTSFETYVYFNGPVDFSSATINDFVKVMGGDNVEFQFFEGATENFFEVYVGNTYMGSFALY
jgi:hypothetical protein